MGDFSIGGPSQRDATLTPKPKPCPTPYIPYPTPETSANHDPKGVAGESVLEAREDASEHVQQQRQRQQQQRQDLYDDTIKDLAQPSVAVIYTASSILNRTLNPRPSRLSTLDP